MSIQKIQNVAQKVSTPVKKSGKTVATMLAASALVFGPMGCKTTSDIYTSQNKAQTTETQKSNQLISKKTGDKIGGASIIGMSAVAAVFGGPAGWAAAAIGVPTGAYIMVKDCFNENAN